MHPTDSETPIAPFRLDPHFLASVIGAAGDRDGPLLRRLLIGLHPADLADVLEMLPGDSLRHVVRLIGQELNPEFLPELVMEKRESVLALLPADYVSRALSELDTDDAALVASDMEEERLEEVLAAAPDDVRAAVESGLSFDEETAGRLMQREFVAAPEFWTVGQTIDHLRAMADALPDRFYEIYVVDPAFRPIGSAALSTMLRAPRERPLAQLMAPMQFLALPEMDQEEVAFAFQRYHLVSAPVVDGAGRLTGMMTVEDIVTVIQEEGTEDLLKLSGVTGAGMADSVLRSMRSRLPWLLLNLFTALTASSVIAGFEGSIEKLVALAVLMPIVASLGGNAGTQTLAISVRAIAARDLTMFNASRFVGREVLTGALNGLLVALLLGSVAGLWFHSAGLALAIGLAVLANLTCAGLIGALVPLGLRRMGADPAVASSVFVTWATDLIGFLSFLGLATWILL